MATKINFRSRVMKTAWQIYRRTSATWQKSLKRAWSVVKATLAMTKGKVEFCYLKMDGSLRNAVGTLRNIPITPKGQKGNKSPHALVCYWDLECGAFRSFRVENFLEVIKSV